MELQQKVDVIATGDVYREGKKEAARAKAELEIRGMEYEALGKIKAARFNIKANELLMYLTFHQIKREKSYRKDGYTWEGFCQLAGQSVRSVDAALSDLIPLIEKFSAASAENFGVPVAKLRYLGRSISAGAAEISGNAILIDGQEIELTPENKDEIEAAIDLMKEAHEKERDEHAKEVKKLQKKLDGAVAEETKALTAERDTLAKEVARLKVFDPEDKDVTWSLDQMREIEKRAAEFVTCCGRFILDERLDENIPLQAKIQGVMKTMEMAFMDLRTLWDDRFTSRFGEQI